MRVRVLLGTPHASFESQVTRVVFMGNPDARGVLSQHSRKRGTQLTSKLVRKRVRWRCPKCKTIYDDKRDAIACNRLSLEPLQFTIGAKVRIRKRWTCTDGQSYEVRGRVVKIIGPQPLAEEYVKLWLLERGHISGRHTFQYVVKFMCPHCKKPKKMRLYALEIMRLR
ncbi:hypothetical protein ACFLZO_01630 [Patescibacteria group bacterium]